MSNSNLPTVQRLYSEDFKTAPSWFQQQFLSTINLFLQSVYNILNGGVDITQNTLEEIYAFSFTCNSGTATDNTYNFTPKKFVGSPHGVLVGQIYCTSAATPTALGTLPGIEWYYNAGQVKIIAIYGLTSGSTYSVSLRIY